MGAILTSRCEENVDIITVPETIHEPALSLFDPIEQKRAIAFPPQKMRFLGGKPAFLCG